MHVIPLALFAGSEHLLIGNVDFDLLSNLLLSLIPAEIISALLSVTLPHGLLHGLLAISLLSTDFKEILKKTSLFR